MTKLSEQDIQLLYKTIVLIEEPGEESKEVAAELPAKDITPEKAKTIEEPIEEVKPAEIKEVLNPYANYEFALVTPKAIKLALLSAGSNCDKIAKALQISHLFESHISLEELQDVSHLAQCKAVWAIGLDTEQQSNLRNSGLNILFSPNPEVLQSPEEKRAMFEPLKAFASSFQPA